MDGLRERKLAEVEDLRRKSEAARAVGESVCNLAPVVGQELEALVQVKLQAGMAEQWDKAKEAASKSEALGEMDPEIGALMAMLIAHSRAAAQCIREHGEQLMHQGASMSGKAEAIEELVAEMSDDAPQEGADEAEP
jgi:hypothetical protein